MNLKPLALNPKSELRQINISSIDTERYRTRPTEMDVVQDYKRSIQRDGLHTPIAVVVEYGKYYLVDGHHRLMACLLLQWASIMVHIVKRPEPCEHNWVSARNEVIVSGEICSKCLMVRAEMSDPLKIIPMYDGRHLIDGQARFDAMNSKGEVFEFKVAPCVFPKSKTLYKPKSKKVLKERLKKKGYR